MFATAIYYFEVGAVFFCISVLVLISLNFRQGGTDDGLPSAYHILNKNAEALPGTTTQADVERQIRHLPLDDDVDTPQRRRDGEYEVDSAALPRGKNRNAPCECGSGIKAKKCPCRI
jgi:hypothetical protein